MASACIKSTNLYNHRNNSLPLSNTENNQNFIIISQSHFNQITQQQTISSSKILQKNSIITQKLKNQLPPIAPASLLSKSSTTTATQSNSVLGMNGINIQSNDCSLSNSNSISIFKKKYTYANIPYGTELPPSVARRNARERNRVKQVNNGYANLRQHIPQTIINALTNGGRGASKKLSKVDTLRLAVEYIRRLQGILIDECGSDTGSDGGSLYSSNVSSSTDCGKSPQSVIYFHNAESPLNDYQHKNINHNDSLPNSNAYIINQIGYSDASVSPAPSYTSDVSISSNHYLSQSPHLNQNQHNHNQFKFEPFDNNYNSITDTTPEDEELLDYISSWQEQ